MPTQHAFDFLAARDPLGKIPAAVVFGDDAFLKQLAVQAVVQRFGGDDAGERCTIFDADDRVPEWRDVHDDLATGSLFGGGGGRIVIIKRADSFVSAQRTRLEDYIAKPGSGLLLLSVDAWAANTRLYKAVDQLGLQIECGPPQRAFGKSKGVDEARLCKWLIARARDAHSYTLKPLAAELLLELVGPNIGMLDQDLAKLALFVPAQGDVTADLVQSAIGGWRAKTSFDAIDAAVDGNAAEALLQLDHLLQSGEHPLALLGAIGWSLRRYAAATRVFQAHERRGSRIPLVQALVEAGVKDWPPGTLKKAEQRLIQMGRHRAGQLYRVLLDADLALKGSHSHDSRARLVLEQMFLRLAKRVAPAKQASGGG